MTRKVGDSSYGPALGLILLRRLDDNFCLMWLFNCSSLEPDFLFERLELGVGVATGEDTLP